MSPAHRFSRRDVPRLALVFLIGAVGGSLFALLGLPAAWLSGAMIATGAAALMGVDAKVPPRLRDVVYMLLGVSMGSGVSPDVVNRLGSWPVSLAGLAITVAAVTTASYLYLTRVTRWDPASAYFGSIPGALSMTLVTAEASRADLRRVTLSQTMRLFMLVAVLPPIVAGAEAGAGAPPRIGTIEDPFALALLVGAGALGSVLGHLARVPAGVLIGAFLVSGALHGAGVVHGVLPAAIQIPAFVALGGFLGLRFSGTTWRMLVGTLVAGIGAFLVALTVAVAGAAAVAAVTGLGFGQVVVAFAPGGLEAMVILAFVLGVDPAFVVAHHLARFLGMTVLVPIVAHLVLGKGWSDPLPMEAAADAAEAEVRPEAEEDHDGNGQ